MDRSPEMPDWQQYVHPEFRLRFSYPTITPQGRMVARTEDERDGSVRVHLTTPDKQELYFEVTRFPNLSPHEEYARHQASLEQRFGAGATTALTETTLGSWPAWAYAFRWDQGERAVILLPLDHDTYRILYDPRSPLNLEVIATISLVE